MFERGVNREKERDGSAGGVKREMVKRRCFAHFD